MTLRQVFRSDGKRDAFVVEGWNVPVLAGAWANVAGGSPAGFWTDPWGTVHLRGVVKTGATGSAIFTLPVRYRPEFLTTLATWCTPGLATVTISTVGVVTQATGRTATSDSIALDGLSFRSYQ